MALQICVSKKFILACIQASVFYLCLANQAKADSFVIGVEDVSYYPYFDFSADNTSFSKALFDQFAKDSGYQISYLPLPIKQFPKWLYENDIDFKFPDNARWQVRNNVQHLDIHFSDEIVSLTAGTVVLAKNEFKEEGFFKDIGTVTGFHPTLWLTQIEQNKVALFEDSSPKILVKHLVSGHIDGLDIDLAVANEGLKQLNLQEKLTLNKRVRRQVYGYQISTVRHPEIIKQFNTWLAEQSDYVDSLKAEYGILPIEPSTSTPQVSNDLD